MPRWSFSDDQIEHFVVEAQNSRVTLACLEHEVELGVGDLIGLEDVLKWFQEHVRERHE